MQYPSPGPGLDDAGRVDQPRYCAALISCKTDNSPARLLQSLKQEHGSRARHRSSGYSLPSTSNYCVRQCSSLYVLPVRAAAGSNAVVTARMRL